MFKVFYTDPTTDGRPVLVTLRDDTKPHHPGLVFEDTDIDEIIDQLLHTEFVIREARKLHEPPIGEPPPVLSLPRPAMLEDDEEEDEFVVPEAAEYTADPRWFS